MNIKYINLTKINCIIFYYIFIFLIFFTISTKANEYEDFGKIGLHKERLGLFYTNYLSVIDTVYLVDDIIVALEENTINKKEAMTEGTKIIKQMRNTVSDTTNQLNNFEKLELSSEFKQIEELYKEFRNHLIYKVEPLMNEEINIIEKIFLNALKGNFEDPLKRYMSQIKRIGILIESENEVLKLDIVSHEENSPAGSRSELYLNSNIFCLDLLNAFVYMFETLYILPEGSRSSDEVLDYFNNLEIDFNELIIKSENSLKEGLDSVDLLSKEFLNTADLTEDEKLWANNVILVMKEGFAIEEEVINNMKKNSFNFSVQNLLENDNAVNDLLDGFNELYYYSVLREEIQIKEATALQKMQQLK